MIAEDDDAMRRFLEVALKRADFETVSARDGAEALEIALNNEIDAVVTDAVMPNLTGFDLIRILRQNREKSGLPIILLTGFDQSVEETEESISPDAYLIKGKDLKELLIATLMELLFQKGKN
ncbi:MAG: response regulator [Pyrinomonadaceae bacterium]